MDYRVYWKHGIGSKKEKGERWIQLPSATVEFVVAPEERDVYSYERTPKGLAPLGAKPGSGTFTGAGNSDCAPWSFGVKKRPPGYKHFAPLGRSDQQWPVALST